MYMVVMGLAMGSLTGLFALGLFTRRAHGAAALIGAFVGAVLLFLVQQYTTVHFFLYAAVGVTACFVVGYLAGFVVPGHRKDLDGLTVYTQTPAKSTQ